MSVRTGRRLDQPHDQEQHDGADRGIDDLRYDAGADMEAELRKQPGWQMNAPAMPTRISPMMPKPAPRTIFPASQPATRPTNRITIRPSLDIYIGQFPRLLARRTLRALCRKPIHNCRVIVTTARTPRLAAVTRGNSHTSPGRIPHAVIDPRMSRPRISTRLVTFGTLSWKSVARWNAAPIRSSMASSNERPISCMPTGRPLARKA